MSLTCISCKLLFSVSELHQEHYKTDWHRYNLKRRLAELPPLTKDDFEKRAAAFKSDTVEKDPKTTLRCDTCNKHFSSENAMKSHLISKKHLELVVKGPSKPKKTFTPKAEPSKPVEEAVCNVEDDDEWSEEGSDWESCDEDGEIIKKIVIDTNDCLFCEHQSDATESNIAHMTEKHSFFIPDIEYLVDLDGLIASLAAKIHAHICLWCDGKGRGFRSVKSVKQHMIDKGHCKMLHEGEALLRYADFYDYPAVDESSESDMNDIDELLDNSDYELVLPSGATIGHRSLSIYYKQNLKLDSPGNEHKVRKVIQQYKALGYTGCSGELAIRKARDIKYVKRIRDRYDLKLGVKNNKMQPHFRPQVMF